jgi:hypothetical protein
MICKATLALYKHDKITPYRYAAPYRRLLSSLILLLSPLMFLALHHQAEFHLFLLDLLFDLL